MTEHLDRPDPDVPILQESLDKLRAAVAAGGITQGAASETLGRIADSLVRKRMVLR